MAPLIKRFFTPTTFILMILLLALVPLSPVQAQDTNLIQGITAELTGWLAVVWGDPQEDQGGEDILKFTLAEPRGRSIDLMLEPEQIEAAGGLLAINRQFISVRGTWTSVQGSEDIMPALQVEELRVLQSPNGPIPGAAPKSVSGPQPWISILCKFSDVPTEPKVTSYFQGMYGSNFPGLDHYWQEVSYNTITTAGSNAFGWVTLPAQNLIMCMTRMAMEIQIWISAGLFRIAPQRWTHRFISPITRALI